MRFYQVTTIHTQEDINKMIKKMSNPELEYIQDLYKKISMVEYTDDNNFECMFAIIDDYFVEKITNLYQKYKMKFDINDITQDIILDNHFRIRYENCYGRSVQLDILKLIKEFKNNWISKDDILDKILEKGIESLTDFDLDVLNS